MTRVRRTKLAVEAATRNREMLAALGRQVRASRKRRQLTQKALGARVDLGRSTLSRIERGLGGGVTLDAWQRIALALDRPLRLEFGRDANEDPADAGHLAIQELVLRSARSAGYARTFEMPTRPTDPARSADVALRREHPRRLVLVECWNTFGDIGASGRSFDRKLNEADQLAAAAWGEEPYRVAGCWVVRASARNRVLAAKYQETFETKFPGSSKLWLQALTTGTEPPAGPGLVWCDVGATRLLAWRRRNNQEPSAGGGDPVRPRP